MVVQSNVKGILLDLSTVTCSTHRNRHCLRLVIKWMPLWTKMFKALMILFLFWESNLITSLTGNFKALYAGNIFNTTLRLKHEPLFKKSLSHYQNYQSFPWFYLIHTVYLNCHMEMFGEDFFNLQHRDWKINLTLKITFPLSKLLKFPFVSIHTMYLTCHMEITGSKVVNNQSNITSWRKFCSARGHEWHELLFISNIKYTRQINIWSKVIISLDGLPRYQTTNQFAWKS